MSTTTKQIGAIIVTTDDDKGTIRIKSTTPCAPLGIDQPENTAKRIGKAIAYLAIIAIPVSLVGIATYCASWITGRRTPSYRRHARPALAGNEQNLQRQAAFGPCERGCEKNRVK